MQSSEVTTLSIANVDGGYTHMEPVTDATLGLYGLLFCQPRHNSRLLCEPDKSDLNQHVLRDFRKEQYVLRNQESVATDCDLWNKVQKRLLDLQTYFLVGAINLVSKPEKCPHCQSAFNIPKGLKTFV